MAVTVRISPTPGRKHVLVEAQKPLTAESPMQENAPLTSEPPLAAELPLTSEPSIAGLVGSAASETWPETWPEM